MKAMSNLLQRWGSVREIRMLVSDGAEPRQAEHLALQRLDDEHQPEQKRGENDSDVDDHHEKWSQDRNQEYGHAQDAQSESHNDTGKPHNEALHRVEAHELILAIRIKQKKNDRRHKRKISQRSGDVL